MAVKEQYSKAAGISFFIHAVLIGLLLILGQLLTKSITAAAPIEVEILAASPVDTEITKAQLSSADFPQAQPHQASAAISSEQRTQESGVGVQQSCTTETSVHNGKASELTANTSSTGQIKQQESYEKKAVTKTRACCVASSKPAYPRDALDAGLEGSVVVRVLIGTDGSAATVIVKASSGHSVLDEAAAQAVKRWRFSPARHGDTPIESYYDVRVKFSLDDA